MKFEGVPGECILLPKASNEISHLWIIITEPIGDQKRVVIANLTSMRSNSDQTVILKKGDHPFIQHDSIINYSDVRFVEVEKLINASAMFPVQKEFDSNILNKIQKGLLPSPHTPLGIKEAFRGKF